MALMRRLLARRWFGGPGFAVVGRRALPRVDRAVRRVTAGRWSVSEAFGMPLLLLTTTGRRSGQPRVRPLTYAQDGPDVIVVGSNWGRREHPAWALNLLATPQARVETRSGRFGVTARALEGEERAEAWQRLIRVWPHYEEYVERARGREFLVFRLTPHSSGD